MHFFDRKFSLALLFFGIPLLFLPKINIINVGGGETAGLRVDDLVLLFFGVLLMWGHARSHLRLYRIEGQILLITALALFSFLANRIFFTLDWVPMESKIFYSLRLLEYFLFFYIGALATQFFSDRHIIRAFLLWNILLMTLQKFNLIGAVASFGYLTDVSSRVQGIASFPSEMGLLLNLLFCYFIFDDKTQSQFIQLFQSPFIRYALHKFYLYGMFCLFGLFIILTGNRISIVALCLCFLFRIKEDLSFRSMGSYLSMMILIPLAALAIGFTIKQTISVYNRSINLFTVKNLDLVTLVWDKVDIKENPTGNERLKSDAYDMSWFLRIHKWLFMAKTYVMNPESWLQGLGPGYAGAALDGGLLRIVTEYGVLGTFFFWKFFGSLYRINRQTKWMILSFMINMLFFDAYLAYKTMSFLLFTCGYAFERQLATRRTLAIPPGQAIGCLG